MKNFRWPFLKKPQSSPPPPPPPPPSSTTVYTTKYFNSIINKLSTQNSPYEVLFTYSDMVKLNIPPDAYTFPSVLKSCTSLNRLTAGKSFHQLLIINGYSTDPYIATSLINFYAKFGNICYARKVFDKMPERNVVPWTAIIGCYAWVCDTDTMFCMYNLMRHAGVNPSAVTMLGMLSGVSDRIQVQCLHACVIHYGIDFNLTLMNSMLNVYGKCGGVDDARCLFECMSTKDLISWNSLLSSYALIGDIKEMLQLLRRMRVEGIKPAHQTFGSLVSEIGRQNKLEIGKMVHAQILTSGFELDAHIETILIAMYLKCGNIDDACEIFEHTRNKDVIMWTTIISGLVHNEFADEALTVLRKMLFRKVNPSTATLASALSACAQLGTLNFGASIHCYILRHRIETDIPTQNSLITMYAKCGKLEQSCIIFDMMDKRDVVSWNAIVAGHAHHGHLYNALYLFDEMRSNLERPDFITIVSLLQACASAGALHQGKWIHNFAIRNSLGPCMLIDTALVDMYSKTGDLDTARKCFDMMSARDVITWGSIITAYGCHGQGELALEVYQEFLRCGHKPDHVIFLSVLCACSHSGLVDQGMKLFESMANNFGIQPKLEHCACIVDLLSRAGRVKEAYEFYMTVFSKPMVDVLGIMLDACRARGDKELGDVIAEKILMLNPEDSGNYVQLAHSYAAIGRWDGVGLAWTRMRSLGLKKVPGWSCIELHGKITTFFNDHDSYHRHDDVVCVLKSLRKESKDLRINFEQNEENFADLTFWR